MNNVPRFREPFVEFLRGVASLAVVIFHINEVRGASDIYGAIASYGWLGVPVFFVLSGYCVALSGFDGAPASTFLARRLMRVFPPYWASLGVVLAVVLWRYAAFGQNDVAPLPKDALSLIATLTLATDPVSNVKTINWVYWTLSYEIAFYLMMTLALVRAQYFQPLIFAITLASTLSVAVPLENLSGLFFFDQWPIFALGVGLALARGEKKNGAYALIVLSAATIVARLDHPVTIAALLTATTIPLFRKQLGPTSARIVQPFLKLGAISYSLYLIHVPIGLYFIGSFIKFQEQAGLLDRLWVDLAVSAACALFAWSFNRLVERPAQRMSHRLFPHADRPIVTAPGCRSNAM